jgi:hypothetical protein
MKMFQESNTFSCKCEKMNLNTLKWFPTLEIEVLQKSQFFGEKKLNNKLGSNCVF